MASPALLTLLHFNIQYCAGGLDGLFGDADFDASDAALQDAIIEESFAPVLDVLVQHPDWTFTLEMQGYMVQIIADRHPLVMDELRTLNAAGRVELVSFHWSDQLFTAFPARDMEMSAAMTRQVFEDNGLTLSPVVFTQEGQFSQGMLDRMPEWGYRIAVLPHNLGSTLWGSIDAPIYSYGDTLVLPSTGNASVGWSFLNDGELWATGDLNCYLGPAFVFNATATDKQVQQIEDAEAAGYVPMSIEAYVDSLTVTPTPLPPVLDGTWQPEDTDNLGLWMGQGGIWAETESDNGVRIANIAARNAVLAAEAVEGVDAALLKRAWEALLLAEVSDATGWNPYGTETRYGLDWSAEAQRFASEALAETDACEDETSVLVEDAGSGLSAVTPGGTLVNTATPTTPSADVPVPTVTGRDATLTWSTDDDGLRLDIAVAAGEGDIAVTFPWDALTYTTVPALGDSLVEVATADIAVREIALPLSWGLAHLSDDWYVIKHLDSVHVAGRFSIPAQTLTFSDTTVPAEAFTWTFHLVGPTMADPMTVARHLNIEPDVIVPCPPEDKSAFSSVPTDCGCASGSGAAWLGLLGIFGLRRRYSV